ncbi:MAG: hypothetical protein ACK6DC_01900 [Planctomycetota bacterium]
MANTSPPLGSGSYGGGYGGGYAGGYAGPKVPNASGATGIASPRGVNAGSTGTEWNLGHGGALASSRLRWIFSWHAYQQ